MNVAKNGVWHFCQVSLKLEVPSNEWNKGFYLNGLFTHSVLNKFGKFLWASPILPILKINKLWVEESAHSPRMFLGVPKGPDKMAVWRKSERKLEKFVRHHSVFFDGQCFSLHFWWNFHFSCPFLNVLFFIVS
jgi:hypothetical protein